MGVGIAYVAAGAGFAVELVEVDPDRARAAGAALDARWDKAVSQGRLATQDAAARRTNVVVATDVAELADEPDVAVEAVPERLDLRWTVLSTMEAKRPRLLATNTSSISIGALAQRLGSPGRFLGRHFFNPVWAMPLLEIVVGPATAAETVAAGGDLAARLGKGPVVVRDAPGALELTDTVWTYGRGNR